MCLQHRKPVDGMLIGRASRRYSDRLSTVINNFFAEWVTTRSQGRFICSWFVNSLLVQNPGLFHVVGPVSTVVYFQNPGSSFSCCWLKVEHMNLRHFSDKISIDAFY